MLAQNSMSLVRPRPSIYDGPPAQKCSVAVSLHDVGDRPAIDLKIENYVPAEVRDPDNDQTPIRLSGGAPVRDYANENKNQTERIGEGVTSPPDARSGLAFGERGVHRSVNFSEVVPAQKGLPGHPNCQSSPGVRHTPDGRRKT
jgi:hypothetical protein